MMLRCMVGRGGRGKRRREKETNHMQLHVACLRIRMLQHKARNVREKFDSQSPKLLRSGRRAHLAGIRCKGFIAPRLQEVCIS
jgi:hypothetical protein